MSSKTPIMEPPGWFSAAWMMEGSSRDCSWGGGGGIMMCSIPPPGADDGTGGGGGAWCGCRYGLPPVDEGGGGGTMGMVSGRWW